MDPSPGYRLVLWSHYLPGQQSSNWWMLGQWVSARTHFAPIPGHLVISGDIFACHNGGKGVAIGRLVSRGQGCCWIQCIGQIAQQIIKWWKRSVLRLKIPHPKGTHRLPGVSRQMALRWFIAMTCCTKSLQSCPTLCDPMDCQLPGCSGHGILQLKILEWVVMPPSRGSSRPRDRTHVSWGSAL